MMADGQSYDVTIIGGGIAGLSVALRLPEHLRVALFTKGQLGESNTRYAQGGLAVGARVQQKGMQQGPTSLRGGLNVGRGGKQPL